MTSALLRNFATSELAATMTASSRGNTDSDNDKRRAGFTLVSVVKREASEVGGIIDRLRILEFYCKATDCPFRKQVCVQVSRHPSLYLDNERDFQQP